MAGLGLTAPPLATAQPVVYEGVWQSAQPTAENSAPPAAVDGVARAGEAGASMWMKLAKASMSDRITTGWPLASCGKFSVSSGVPADMRHAGASSRRRR